MPENINLSEKQPISFKHDCLQLAHSDLSRVEKL